MAEAVDLARRGGSLAAAGAAVAINDIDAERAHEARDAVAGMGGEAVVVHVVTVAGTLTELD